MILKLKNKLQKQHHRSYDQNDGLVTMKGEFIYVAADNAAVLQTSSEIYGVVVDEKMHELQIKLQLAILQKRSYRYDSCN